MSIRTGAGQIRPLIAALYAARAFTFPQRALSPLHILGPALCS